MAIQSLCARYCSSIDVVCIMLCHISESGIVRYYFKCFFSHNQKPSEKYVEPIAEEGAPNYEQKRWEEDHVRKGEMHFGARDAKQRHKVCLFVCMFVCFLLHFNETYLISILFTPYH